MMSGKRLGPWASCLLKICIIIFVFKKFKICSFHDVAGELIQVFKVGYVHELITNNDHMYTKSNVINHYLLNSYNVLHMCNFLLWINQIVSVTYQFFSFSATNQ